MLKSIHFKAFAIWLIYSFITKGSFVTGVSKSIEGRDAYILNIFFSMVFGFLFLYFFSHEDFFKFACEIERKNTKKEKKWEHKLIHFGKIITSIIIGVLSGPLIGALAVRFIKPKYKYLVIGLSSALSSVLWLGLVRDAAIIRLPF